MIFQTFHLDSIFRHEEDVAARQKIEFLIEDNNAPTATTHPVQNKAIVTVIVNPRAQ